MWKLFSKRQPRGNVIKLCFNIFTKYNFERKSIEIWTFFIITVIDNIKFLILGRKNKPSPY